MKKMNELQILSNLDAKCQTDLSFRNYLRDYYNVNKMTDRYIQLLDEFLSDYALDKTEKSENTISS